MDLIYRMILFFINIARVFGIMKMHLGGSEEKIILKIRYVRRMKMLESCFLYKIGNQHNVNNFFTT